MKYIYLIFLCFFAITTWSGTAGAENGQDVLSLDQCIELVFTKNPKLAFTLANKEEKQDWSASKKDLYPTLFADYSYLRQPNSPRTDFFTVPKNYYDYAFTVLLDAETLLTRAKVSYYNPFYDYNIALATVNWASGFLI